MTTLKNDLYDLVLGRFTATPTGNKASWGVTLIILVLGMAGAFSFRFLGLEVPAEARDVLTQDAFATSMAITISIFVFICVVVGHFLAPHAGVRAPVIEGLLSGKMSCTLLNGSLNIAAIFGIAVLVLSLAIEPWLFSQLSEETLAAFINFNMVQTPWITKFLYGGLAEQVVMDWAVLSLVLWLSLKTIGRLSRRGATLAAVFVTAVVATAVHAPTLPSILPDAPQILFLYYNVFGFLGALIAAALTVKKGIESAMIFKLTIVFGSLVATSIFA
jgi:hypothetical protein